jgi:hypothetical protein
MKLLILQNLNPKITIFIIKKLMGANILIIGD